VLSDRETREKSKNLVHREKSGKSQGILFVVREKILSLFLHTFCREFITSKEIGYQVTNNI